MPRLTYPGDRELQRQPPATGHRTLPGRRRRPPRDGPRVARRRPARSRARRPPYGRGTPTEGPRMAPHLETIDVPDGVEDAAADALDHPFVVDGLAWGLRPMVELLADYHANPAMDELVGPARQLRERLDDLLEAGDGARLRGARRTPRHLLALARFARRTVVPSFASMADVPPIAGDAAVGALRDELGALIAPQGGADAGHLP